jgi:hypothetical protein
MDWGYLPFDFGCCVESIVEGPTSQHLMVVKRAVNVEPQWASSGIVFFVLCTHSPYSYAAIT